MKSSYWRRKARQPGSFLPAASRFGPCDASRARASSAVSPTLGSTPSPLATWSTSAATGSGMLRSATGARSRLAIERLHESAGLQPESCRLCTPGQPHPTRGIRRHDPRLILRG